MQRTDFECSISQILPHQQTAGADQKGTQITHSLADVKGGSSVVLSDSMLREAHIEGFKGLFERAMRTKGNAH